MRCVALLAFLHAVLATEPSPTEPSNPEPPNLEPSNPESGFLQRVHPDAIRRQYIVKLNTNVKEAAEVEYLSSIMAQANFTYPSFPGFSAMLTRVQVEELDHLDEVDFIEPELRSTLEAVQVGVPAHRSLQKLPRAPELRKAGKKITQYFAPWGLSRISSYSRYRSGYVYNSTAGTGTCVYVLDSGVDSNHLQFQQRAKFLKNFAGGSDHDMHGHGTFVAGVIGSTKYGVAKNTTILSVKVLDDDGNGLSSHILAGIDFVANDVLTRKCPKGAVVNMGFSTPRSRAINLATQKMFNNGLFVVAAAGNQARFVSSRSPASDNKACTVAAIGKDDTFAPYSNFGFDVNLLAPGSQVKSLSPGGATRIDSGTSAASAHVAGLGAYLLGMGESNPRGLCSHMKATALAGKMNMGLDPSSETPNLLINNGFLQRGILGSYFGST